MDPLAAAKMKATTTVTLLIIFLIAVGCSSAELNLIEQEFKQEFNEFDVDLDQEGFLRHLRQSTQDSTQAMAHLTVEDLIDELGYHERRLDEFVDEYFDEYYHDALADALDAQIDALNALNARLDICICWPWRKYWRRLRQEVMQVMRLRQEQKEGHLKDVRLQRHQRLRFQEELRHRLQVQEEVQEEEGQGQGQEVKEELQQKLQKLQKLQQQLQKQRRQKVKERQEKLIEKALESMKSKEHLSGCKRQMGDIWIAVGLLTAFTFFMVLTFRVFRNLGKQRKSGRKSHAFPIDDLGGVTNLPGQCY